MHPGRANLLILWGALESDRFVDAAGAALRAGYPEAVPGRTYGEFAAGTGAPGGPDRRR